MKQFLPKSITLYLTTRCPLRCPNCFLVQNGTIGNYSLTIEEILPILDEAQQGRVFLLAITGGDPLLHPEFFRVVEEARKRKILPLLGSSGIGISSEKARKIKEAGIPGVQLSLDGSSEQINSRYRGAGVFDKVMQSINHLSDQHLHVTLAIAVDQNNLDDLPNFLRMAKSNGLQGVKVEIYKSVKPSMSPHQLEKHQHDEVREICAQFVKENDVPENWIISPVKRMQDFAAPIGDNLVIFANGDVSRTEGATILGNVKKQTISQIWQYSNSER